MDKNIICDPSLSAESRLIYTILACYADKKRECYPSVETLIQLTGFCRSTFYKHMKILTDKGLVEKTPRKVGNLYNGVTYKINDSV